MIILQVSFPPSLSLSLPPSLSLSLSLYSLFVIVKDDDKEVGIALQSVPVDQILEMQREAEEEQKKKKDIRRQLAIKTDEDIF